MHLSKPEMELYHPFLANDKKTFKSFFLPWSSTLIFITGNGIIKIGNGIISPLSGLFIKFSILQNVFHFQQGVKNLFSKEMQLSKMNE